MADQNLAQTLQKRIVTYAALGMLAVGGIAALAGILPLTAQLRKAQEKNLQVDLRRQTRAVEAYIARAKSSPATRLARGGLRDSMEAHARGRITMEELRLAARQWLTETIQFSSNTMGVCLLDVAGNLIAQDGLAIPREFWPPTNGNAREFTLSGPVQIGNEFLLVSGGPVLSSQLDRVGAEIVLYKLSLLEKIIHDYSDLERTGETIVGDLGNKALPVFFSFRPRPGSRALDPGKNAAIRQALELAQSGRSGVLLPEDSPDPSMVIAYAPVEGAGWGILLAKSKREFDGPINRRLGGIVAVLIVLVLAGTFAVVQALKPLTGRLILHTDELASQIYEKTAALNTELAERKRAELASRDAEALYHSLVDTLPISILRKDLQGRVTYGNKGYCEMMKRPLSELIGKTDFDLFPKELAQKFASDDDRVVTTGMIFEDIEANRKPDGTRIYVHVLKAPVRDARDNIVGTQVIFWDVTARKLAEEGLAHTAADLARSNKELEQFAYVASHDLQEPLRMVTSYTQLIARRYSHQLDQNAVEFMGFAVDGAQRMQRLINDLLTYSRVGTHGKAMSLVSATDCLQAALDNLKLALDESSASVARDPLPTVIGDSGQLTQLFQNLIGNALKFRSTDPPHLRITVERHAAPACPVPTPQSPERHAQPEEWIIHIRDNGIGIEPQYFERIFVIFQRLHTHDQYPGTGIGLAICKKIVERHGGRIWVESAPGAGTTFSFALPVPPV